MAYERGTPVPAITEHAWTVMRVDESDMPERKWEEVKDGHRPGSDEGQQLGPCQRCALPTYISSTGVPRS